MAGLLFGVTTLLLSQDASCFLGVTNVKPNSALFSYLDSLGGGAVATPAAPAAPSSFGTQASPAPASTGGYLSSIGADTSASAPPKSASPFGKKPVASASSGGYLSQLASPAPAAPEPPKAEFTPLPETPAAPATPSKPAVAAPVAAGSSTGYLGTLSTGSPMDSGSAGPPGYLDALATGTPLAGGSAGPAGYLDALSPAVESTSAPVSYAPHKGNVVVREGNDLASQRHSEIMTNLKIILKNQEEMKKDISSLLKNSGMTSSASYTPVTIESAPEPAAPAPVAEEPAAPSAPASTGGYLSSIGGAAGAPFKGLKKIPVASTKGPAGYLDAL